MLTGRRMKRVSIKALDAPPRTKPTLVTNLGESQLEPGMCAGFKAGSGDAHYLLNRTRSDVAAPEARQLLTDSVKKMAVQDAKGILTGGETSGTDYFKRTTRTQLHDRFLPIVKKSTAKVGVAQKYNEYAEQGAALGLVNKADANLDEYVTQKALDGLYFMVAEEKKKIRKDPAAAGTAILRKVFGTLQK
jgi:hypothetical protein